MRHELVWFAHRVERPCRNALGGEGTDPAIVEAGREAHPYEEVAFDLYPLADE